MSFRGKRRNTLRTPEVVEGQNLPVTTNSPPSRRGGRPASSHWTKQDSTEQTTMPVGDLAV